MPLGIMQHSWIIFIIHDEASLATTDESGAWVKRISPNLGRRIRTARQRGLSEIRFVNNSILHGMAKDS